VLSNTDNKNNIGPLFIFAYFYYVTEELL